MTSKDEPPRTAVSGLITILTDWLHYRKQIRLRDKNYLQYWVFLLWRRKEIVHNEWPYGDYLLPLFCDLELNDSTEFLLKCADIVEN